MVDQLPRLGKRELNCLVLFTCNYVVSVGEVSSSSGCLEWSTLFIVALTKPSIYLFCKIIHKLVYGILWFIHASSLRK